MQYLTACVLAAVLALPGDAEDTPDAKPDQPDAPEGMVWIPGGAFAMGNDHALPNEAPMHAVTVDPFFMDTHEVTNAEFKKFVDETGYVTVAEKKPKAEDFPGAPEEMLVPGAVVFQQTDGPVPRGDYHQWWAYVPGANWRRPEGPESSIEDRMDHPVVHVAFEDAQAYAEWAGKRLPTEAEWEFAARGGLKEAIYVWGDDPKHRGGKMANLWQGHFPAQNTVADGHKSTAPVGSFPPNKFGLYDIAGNVWEWTTDWYHPDYYAMSPKNNPKGPSREQSFDPQEPGAKKRVLRGGSFLCNDSYCAGYRPSARMATTPDTGLCHTGFRCVKDAPTKDLQEESK